MKKESLKKAIGCVGRRIKIIPEKSNILGQEDIIGKGKIIAIGPDVKIPCKIGDIIVFSTDGYDKVTLDDQVFHYILGTDQFIYEIL